MRSQRVEPYATAWQAARLVQQSATLLDQHRSLMQERAVLLAQNRKIFGEVADLARQFADSLPRD